MILCEYVSMWDQGTTSLVGHSKCGAPIVFMTIYVYMELPLGNILTAIIAVKMLPKGSSRIYNTPALLQTGKTSSRQASHSVTECLGRSGEIYLYM